MLYIKKTEELQTSELFYNSISDKCRKYSFLICKLEGNFFSSMILKLKFICSGRRMSRFNLNPFTHGQQTIPLFLIFASWRKSIKQWGECFSNLLSCRIFCCWPLCFSLVPTTKTPLSPIPKWINTSLWSITTTSRFLEIQWLSLLMAIQAWS